MDRYLVISSDTHAGPPAEVFRDYMDPDFRETYDQALAAQAEARKDIRNQSGLTVRFGKPRAKEITAPFLESERVKSEGQHGAWDPVVREREMDRDGVAAEIIFPIPQEPGAAPPFGAAIVAHSTTSLRGDTPYDKQYAGARAYNRWLADMCSHDPDRHGGAIICPMHDIEAALTEIRRARESGVSGGLLLPVVGWATTEVESLYYHPRFEPVWELCEELDLPLLTHPLVSGIDHGDFGSKYAMESAEVFSPAHRPLWFLLLSGVFERHPKLTLTITEAGGSWMPNMMFRFDDIYVNKKGQELRETISRKPSEVWAEHGFIGASPPGGRLEVEQRDQIGVGNIIWGSDYPHFEGTWPYVRERMKAMFAGVPEDETRLMLGENGFRAFNFDRKKLAAIAERIGPKVSELDAVEPTDSVEYLKLWVDREALANLAKS